MSSIIEEAKALVKSGQLDEGLAKLKEAVRKNPSDLDMRLFLWQLLAVMGDYTASGKQLSAFYELQGRQSPMPLLYHGLMEAELYRGAVFEGKREPVILGEPDPWIGLLQKSLQLASSGREGEALKLQEEALQLAPARSGIADGVKFEWIADADPRLGPVFEWLYQGTYYWLPQSNVDTIRWRKPEDLRDLVWLPMELTLKNGSTLHGFTPSRYPHTERLGSGMEKLGRGTQWEESEQGWLKGVGQKLWVLDSDEKSLFELREVTFDVSI